MDLKNLGLDGEYKHLNTRDVRPADSKATSVMSLEATVDVKKQDLKKLKPFNAAIMAIPVTLRPESQIVLQAIMSCFERQGYVEEGLIGDLMWGFAECGIAPELTLVGLRELEMQNYVKFQTPPPDNTWINIESEFIGKAWIRYQPKLLNMVYTYESHEIR